MIGALAQSLEVAPRPDGPGTAMTMSFAAAAQPPEVPGLEPLCALALESVADVSCVDVVRGGVLRRATAEVAGDPALTTWLRGAVPPAKPGTVVSAARRRGPSRRPRPERSSLTRRYRRAARADVVGRRPPRRFRWDASSALGP